jgi:hypothetical protein
VFALSGTARASWNDCTDNCTLAVKYAAIPLSFTITMGTPPPAGSAASSIGCFVDSDSRDLSGPSTSSDSMTVEACSSFCTSNGYAYFGVQYTSQCFCGQSYGAYGQASASDCNMACNGNGNETCGGTWRNSVYATGVAAPAPPPTSGSGPSSIGCFVDSDSRDLSGPSTASGNMSVETCNSFCANSGYPYFGVQYGSLCFCGQSYGAYGPADASDCNMACGGNGGETCGGTWRNNVYRTGVSGSSPPPASDSSQVVQCSQGVGFGYAGMQCNVQLNWSCTIPDYVDPGTACGCATDGCNFCNYGSYDGDSSQSCQ